MTRRSEIQEIIVDGNAQKLVSTAMELGERLNKSDLSSAQLRATFSSLRRIEQLWGDPQTATVAQRQLILLRPKMMYQEKRNSSVKQLRSYLDEAIQQVGNDRQRFGRLIEFVEAIIAYHK